MTEIFYVEILKTVGKIDEMVWDRIVADDPELEPVNSLPGRNPITMKPLQASAPHSAKWLGHPDGITFYFRFKNGILVMGSVDKHGLSKAETLAVLLGAEVNSSDD